MSWYQGPGVSYKNQASLEHNWAPHPGNRGGVVCARPGGRHEIHCRHLLLVWEAIRLILEFQLSYGSGLKVDCFGLGFLRLFARDKLLPVPLLRRQTRCRNNRGLHSELLLRTKFQIAV